MNRIILHIDFDSYFASCEQQFNPSLRGKPIGVTAQNGRHCIIAASKEAKRLGIKSPAVTYEALQKVPDMIFVPAHFEKYWEITQKFLDICKDYSPYVELFSLDEVFMDITSTQKLFGGKHEVIRKIKKRIKNEIGEYITVSAGISFNKLLAKLASGINKPNARPLTPERSNGERVFFEITPYNMDEIYAKCKLTDFCGIGERIALRLQKLGIHTPLALKQSPLDLLVQEFKNAEGHFLYNLGQGQDDSKVIPYYIADETKSVGRNYCLPKNEYDKRVIFQNVYELCEEVALKLRRLKKNAKTAFIYLGGSKSVHGRKTVSRYFESANVLFEICLLILKENNFILKKDDYIRRISVGASSLSDSKNITLSLFENDNKKHKLLEVVDKINEKYGDHVIRNGFLLNAPKLTTAPNGYMADRYEREKLVDSFNLNYK